MFATCLATLLLTAWHAFAQDYNCDFVQKAVPGYTYPVRSPGYPLLYKPGVQCRWIVDCPTGYNCRLDCGDINLPQTISCSQDRLLVSKIGDTQLNGADYYCGRGTLTAVSTGTRISVGLITANNSPGGSFSCVAYAQPASTPGTCSCGYKKQNRIVGGVETGVNEYPMMAALVDSRIYEVKCGGTIISKRHILTAAHCIDNGLDTNTLAVVVGEHNVDINDSPATQGFRVSKINIHPLFVKSSDNYDYDVAILTLASDIVFSDRVGPACLPFKFQNTDTTGWKLTILGWGTTSIGGPKSKVLQKVDVDVISQSRCQSIVPTVTSRQICTLTPGKDACQDDSGGPLLYYDFLTGALFSMGIVSYGQFCANAGKPGVNTRVPALLQWIVNTTPEINYCRK